MPLYESKKNAENYIAVSEEVRKSVNLGADAVIAVIARLIKAKKDIRIAFDGWYDIDWQKIIPAINKKVAVKAISVNTIFHPPQTIEKYRQTFTVTDDPGFGIVNTDGHIIDLIDQTKLAILKNNLKKNTTPTIVYGPGAAIPELIKSFDLVFYFDKTRQPILWEMWSGKLVPFGQDQADKNYFWKSYYYCDYYLLDRQKEFIYAKMDYYVEGIAFDSLKMMPRASYDAIIQTMLEYPVKEVPIYQPGPWGAYRYKDIFEVPGLECNAWNELAGPELSMLIDIGLPEMLNMPAMNLMQYADKFVGKHIAKTYPNLFPLDIWLDDGYFPKPTPAERISMPIHSHPSTDYVKQHFNEPLGRYETYYIAEAYEGANTWLGFKDDANVEEWERLARESNNLKEIPNWKDFIANHDSNVGDLYLIPPGTTHGHGGNQMVLEMDTCPSVAATEYSFFTYDFARPSWDDNTKTMTGKPVKMHLEHGFDNDKFVRESWAKEHLLAKPKVIKWTKDYQHDRYSSDPRMPFEIERLHFSTKAQNDTSGKFMHIVTLTIGDEVTIRSKKNPERKMKLLKFQSAIIPAAMGEYEVISDNNGFKTLVILHWKKG